MIINAELDEKMAGVMGWHLDDIIRLRDYQVIGQGWFDKGNRFQVRERDWHPSTDLNQAWQVEEIIIKRRLWEYYIDALGSISKTMTPHATARERCLAVLQAMEAE